MLRRYSRWSEDQQKESRLICGISGFCLSPEDNSHINSRRLARWLLKGIEHRGQDATGAGWRRADGFIEIQKDAINASRFVKRLSTPRKAQAVILHTRFATQGSEHNNLNNHPVRVRNIVGVHNGMLWNDGDLFHEMGVGKERIAEVDSEAIFAALSYGFDTWLDQRTTSGEPEERTLLTNRDGGDVTTYMDVLGRLEGSCATAFMNTFDDNDTIHVARCNQSPVVWAQTVNGSFVFASTAEAIMDACQAVGLEIEAGGELDEGTYMQVSAGRIVEFHKFETGYLSGWRGHMGGYSSYSYRGIKSTVRSIGDLADSDPWADDMLYGCDGPAHEYVDMGTGEPVRVGRRTPPDLQNNNGGAFVMGHEPSKGDTTTVEVPASTDNSDSLDDLILFAHYLRMGADVGHMTYDSHHQVYSMREHAIATWALGLHGCSDTQLYKLHLEMHAWMRVGDWVATTLAGKECWGQLYKLPQSFPGGAYIVRLLVESKTRTNKFEPVFVSREWFEFEPITGAEQRSRAREFGTSESALDVNNSDELSLTD